MITGIDHIDIAVKDVEGSVKLFEKMGFKVLRRQSHHGGTAELVSPGADPFILDLHPAVKEHLDGKLGLTHIAFRVDDPQDVHDQLARNGVKFGDSWENAYYIPSTGRTLCNLLNSPSTDCLGEWYVQFVGPVREEPDLKATNEREPIKA